CKPQVICSNQIGGNILFPCLYGVSRERPALRSRLAQSRHSGSGHKTVGRGGSSPLSGDAPTRSAVGRVQAGPTMTICRKTITAFADAVLAASLSRRDPEVPLEE